MSFGTLRCFGLIHYPPNHPSNLPIPTSRPKQNCRYRRCAENCATTSWLPIFRYPLPIRGTPCPSHRDQFKRFRFVLPGYSLVKLLTLVPIGRGNPAPTRTNAIAHLLSRTDWWIKRDSFVQVYVNINRLKHWKCATRAAKCLTWFLWERINSPLQAVTCINFSMMRIDQWIMWSTPGKRLSSVLGFCGRCTCCQLEEKPTWNSSSFLKTKPQNPLSQCE